MSRKKRVQGGSTPPTNLSAFRDEERRWKSRIAPPDLSLAFDADDIVWDEPTAHSAADEPVRGTWTSGTGHKEECYRIALDELVGTGFLGQTRWKGKQRAEVGDYAIIPAGFVFFPRILPEQLQRDLVVETLCHAGEPNLTSLDNHYELPPGGLWNAWREGRGDQAVRRKAFEPEGRNESGIGTSGSGFDSRPTPNASAEHAPVRQDEKAVTVADLLTKLRWANVGWHYNWSTKLYEYERGQPPLPPFLHRCCRTLARVVPWQQIYRPDDLAASDDCLDRPALSREVWAKWKETYEPDAGIVNFYQAKDSLTSHVDLAEVDAVSPLVSLSLGLSSIFLVGGTSRDVPPLAILLRSGDALIVSGPSRRAYHALPRVLEGTLPDHLRPDPPDLDDEQKADYRLYGEYLERGARINVNVRSVM
ncbi:hypothetical protein JCM8202v2_002068 [Rhodotorula sphaerocarpa]